MFQQQPPPHAQMQQQRKENNYLSSDVQAREKLSQFVYEYLYQLGATKTAETFKNEFLAHNMPNLQIDLSSSSGPGFLYNWWSVFWDLYSAHPDKKDKMFPNYNNVPPDAAMVNGGMYGPGGGAVFPNPAMGPGGAPPQNLPDGMFPNAYYGPRGGPQPGPSSNQASPIPGGGGPPRYGQQGTRSGAPTPSSVVGVGGPNFPMGIGPPQMMTLNEQQQLRMMMARQQQQHQLQQANQAVRMQMNNGGRAVRAQFNNAQYMDSPSGTPPFHNPLVHNGVGGVMCPTTASLMSPAGAPGGPPQQQDVSQQQHQQQQHFMMANQVPVSMQSQFVNHHDNGGGGGAVGTPGGGGGGTGPASVSAQNTMNNGNGGLGEQSGDGGGRAPPNGGGGGANGPLHSLLNGTAGDGGGGSGTEMKQSPPFSGGGGGGVNGGTPGSNVGGGGGGGSQTAGPSSVHSQSGGGGQQQSQQQQSSSMGDGAMEFHQSSEEISKIKASLMDDFQQHQFQQQ